MKNIFIHSILGASLAFAPVSLMAQGKGDTETVPGVSGQPQPGGVLGKSNDEPTQGKPKRESNDWFDRMDANNDGSISREEFAQANARRMNRDRAEKADENRKERAEQRNREQQENRAESTSNEEAATNTGNAAGTNSSSTDTTNPQTNPAGTSTGTGSSGATGTTGTTGGTGSSASSSGQSGAATSGTGQRPQ